MSDLRLSNSSTRYDHPGSPNAPAGAAASFAVRGGVDLSFDTVFAPGQFALDDGLHSAVYLSLFTDATARDDDELPETSPGPFPNRRGYWADHLSSRPADRHGSRLWLLRGRPLNRATAARARTYALEALEWIPELGIGTVAVATQIVRRGVLEIDVTITDDAPLPERRFRYLWSAMLEQGVV